MRRAADSTEVEAARARKRLADTGQRACARAYAREGVRHIQLVIDPITRGSIEAFAPIDLRLIGSAEPAASARWGPSRSGTFGSSVMVVTLTTRSGSGAASTS